MPAMRSTGGDILRNAGRASVGAVGRRSKRAGAPVLPVKGHFYFQIEDWDSQIMEQWPRNPVLRSDVQLLYGNFWQLLVFPRGSLNEESRFVEVQLVNRTDKSIHAKYTVSIWNHSEKRYDYSWSDPDGTVLFKPYGDDDDYWGNYEFIELHALESHPYKCANSVRFKVEIEANIVDELGALTPTTNPMGDVKPGTSLEIAKSELKQLSTHMSEQKVRMIKEEERLQDCLINKRVDVMKQSSFLSNTNPLNFSL